MYQTKSRRRWWGSGGWGLGVEDEGGSGRKAEGMGKERITIAETYGRNDSLQ